MAPPRQPTLLAPEPGSATLKPRPWGGSRLAALRGADASISRPIGESWEFSTMPGSESHSQGRPLSAHLDHPLPFLAKLLDTARDLSLQVHPGDDDANGLAGKEEAWVVLEADPGAHVLCGVRQGVGTEDFAATVRRAAGNPKRGEDLLGLMHRIPVSTGTVVIVPAGTVHAVGAGILLAEIQQPSDCTLRLFDYGSDRDLHLDAALAATRIEARPPVWQPGSPADRLRGRHLTLDVLPPGEARRVAEADELLVTFGGEVHVWLDAERQSLPAGSLRLATRGLSYAIEVPPGSGAVIGRVQD